MHSKKLIAPTLIASILFIPSISFASSEISSTRNDLINKQLDCVSAKPNKNDSVGWADVCYTGAYQEQRNKLIDQNLDWYEKKQTKVKSTTPTPQPAIILPEEEPKINYPMPSLKTSRMQTESAVLEENVITDDTRQSAKAQWQNKWLEANLRALTGIRTDYLQWNIAGDTNGQNPNILSELTWKNIVSIQNKLEGNLVLGDHVMLEASGAYGDIIAGKTQDSDYNSDDYGDEFSRSVERARGNTVDFSAGLGYRFRVDSLLKDILNDDGKEVVWFAPMFGLSEHHQNFNMTHGNQLIPDSGDFPGLDENYEALWRGHWYGFDLSGQKGKISGGLRFEYHLADYEGKGNWNLRDDFDHPISFRDYSKAQGIVFNLNGSYDLNDRWKIGLETDINQWHGKNGLDYTFFSDKTSAVTRFNRVDWDSYAYMLSATYKFW